MNLLGGEESIEIRIIKAGYKVPLSKNSESLLCVTSSTRL